MPKLRTALFALILAALLLPGVVLAQDTAPAATTTADPRIPLPDLEDLLRAPTADELVVEVESWQQLLRDTVAEIGRLNIELRNTEDDARKTEIRERLTALSTQRSGLAERFARAIHALKQKGGDVAKYQSYADAVSGIAVTPTDASTATTMFVNWLKSPEGGVRWGKNIGFAVVTLVIFWFLAVIAAGITGAAIRRTRLRITEGLRRFFLSTVRKAVFLLGIILALSMLEVDIGPFIAAIGVGGFVLGFALQETLGNFAAGILILMYRPFEIGHFVNAGGISGTVQDISLVSTKFLTPDNQTIIVPNGTVWGGVITNVTGNATRRVDLTFGISYGDDIAKAEKALTEVVKAHPKVLADPAPVIKVHALADSSVNLICRPWVRTTDYWEVYWDLMRTVKERFDSEEITIPFPQRDVHLHQTK